MRFLFLIASNLKRKKLRTLLTILSILVAFLLFGYLSAIRVALSSGVDVADADRLVIRHKVSIIQLLPESYGRDIARMEGVAQLTHATWFGGIYQEPKNFFPQMPVHPDDYLAVYPEVLLPDDQLQAWKNTKTGAIVGRTTADRFGFEIGDRVPILSPIWPQKDGNQTWEFDIVGIYDGAEQGTDTSPLFFRYDYFDETHMGDRGQVGWYVLRVTDADLATQVAEAIDANFANSFAETKSEPEGAFVQAFAKQIGNIAAIMIAILSMVFFTILLVAGNTMAQSVHERTRELAVLKSIGFTDRGTLFLVLGESTIISAIGGLMGLGLAWLMISAGDPTKGAFPVFYFPEKDIVLGLLLVGALGLAAGIFPALQAKQLRIADALRR
ncbi:FtsX-like permease family protein [Sulfidibacter corallicola]|uniref:FtsX-like permease family protein n=1 Tax=Sulfidibacter corallicola TaxID=2818388 RepID=A0A8A4TGI4_SULCO|nr:FtsX-like permease family protein [Sulfidibacter corallicola]QTD48314.1 FtsX-like permease family protein [Sulfidibacter corallicola]